MIYRDDKDARIAFLEAELLKLKEKGSISELSLTVQKCIVTDDKKEPLSIEFSHEKKKNWFEIKTDTEFADKFYPGAKIIMKLYSDDS